MKLQQEFHTKISKLIEWSVLWDFLEYKLELWLAGKSLFNTNKMSESSVHPLASMYTCFALSFPNKKCLAKCGSCGVYETR